LKDDLKENQPTSISVADVIVYAKFDS